MLKNNNISSIEIVDFSGLKFNNLRKFNIKFAKAPDDLCVNSITLLTRIDEFDILFSKAPDDIVAIIPNELKEKANSYKQLFLFSDNPKLSFVKILSNYFNSNLDYKISKSANVNSTGIIHQDVSIGENVVITGHVDIGQGTQIKDNVVIEGPVIIGKNVVIKSGTIIGQKGFNFVKDENNIPLPFIHMGKVIIGDYVELGALNTVVQGTLSDTIISDFVKTDDHVHIAHNVSIGKYTLITAHAEISGSVIIGENCWLGPNCSIIDHITIGNNVFIGLGSVVTKSLSSNILVVGNPARKLKDI